MTHVVDSYDMSLKYFLFPLDPWPLSEKVHFFYRRVTSSYPALVLPKKARLDP